MTTKTLIRNLKRLEKVMVWMLDLPVASDCHEATNMAMAGGTVVLLDAWMIQYGNGGRCGCVGGFYEDETGRDSIKDFTLSNGYTIDEWSSIFSWQRGKGDTVRSRLAIVRRLIKKMEREDDK